MRRLSALFTSLPLRKNLPMTVTSFDRLCEGATVVMVIGPHLQEQRDNHVLARSLFLECPTPTLLPNSMLAENDDA
jgi:hypothetical protein